MVGFFESIGSEPKFQSTIPRCGSCGLFKTCRSPKMSVTGMGEEGILVVAEAPGKDEDEQGTQLIGESGQILRKHLRELGVDLDRDCWKTNAVCCRPPDNETPSDEKIAACRPNVLKAINKLHPRMIILLGGSAVQSVIEPLWHHDGAGYAIGRWVGWQIPSQKWNAWICPTYHPAYLRRSNDPAVEIWFHKHLESALELSGTPWPGGPPNFLDEVEVIMEPSRAARIVRKMIEKGCRYSWDLETNMLKPDSPDARIVSCGICWNGEKTIAYPWHGDAVTATKDLLTSGMESVGANIKFESRWVRRFLGVEVNRWVWDCMVAAHVLDNRQGITSVKFQAFVRLGTGTYDSAVAPYLKSDGRLGANTMNEIHRVELKEVLKYNGMDALVEWKIAEKQMLEMGVQDGR